ncbi:unnamed protein product [Vitrella brassicaformis CCMP3155]|uniref:Deacetylase sirtuin-type domain-containing protein n=1 Tax=Vitrella brassicaformis (strain CCMP3155) TaxID=1169540 RepID=A0A0G4EQ86_VITBC|nr:unnamed protein product [Vitrella brassicaformis CCMP3155]|eukprot:CEL99577.1 unnamed protein product [Vitrella brassicaformis CCMP3155]
MGQLLSHFSRKETKVSSFHDLAEELVKAKHVVALTGAGVSAPSGIPTFRDPRDGIWRRYDPSICATIWGFRKHPDQLWRLLLDFCREVDPKPNPAHRALAMLEQLGCMHAIITQNIDGLHQEAGSSKVLEFHGNLMNSVCMSCRDKTPLNKDVMTNPATAPTALPPRCTKCDGILKPDAVLFGEAIPSYALWESRREAQRCDLMLVIGTSANVSPASDLPRLAMASQPPAKIIEISKTSTQLTHRVSDVIIKADCVGLSHTVEAVTRLKASSTRS